MHTKRFSGADMPLSPNDLIANPDVAELLGACSYEIAIEPEGPAWFTVDGIPAVRQIGEDSIVSSSDVVVRPPDGEPLTTLFGKFTIDNNPFLRDAVDGSDR
jgi:hypothetical protein